MSKFWLAAMGMSAALLSTPAAAASIVYAGTQQVESASVAYRFTTDGVIGTGLDPSHISSFQIEIADALSRRLFTQLDSQIYGVFGASATTMFIPLALTPDAPARLMIVSNETFIDRRDAAVSFDPLGTMVVFGDTAHGSSTASALQPNLTGFAFVPAISSPVPEVASWAMMVAGFGLLGSAMRRSRVRRLKISLG